MKHHPSNKGYTKPTNKSLNKEKEPSLLKVLYVLDILAKIYIIVLKLHTRIQELNLRQNNIKTLDDLKSRFLD